MPETPGKPGWQPMLAYAAASDAALPLLDLLFLDPERAAAQLRAHARATPLPDTWPLVAELIGDPALMAELAPVLEQALDEIVVPSEIRGASLLYAAYETHRSWTGETRFTGAQEALRHYLQDTCFSAATGWFFPGGKPDLLTLDGMWPLVVGAATGAQGWAVRTTLLQHRWHGEEVFWAAGGCIRLGHPEAARPLLEATLDDYASALVPSQGIPLVAMAHLWEQCQE